MFLIHFVVVVADDVVVVVSFVVVVILFVCSCGCLISLLTSKSTNIPSK